MLWYFYSILCILFIAILVVDLLLIWGVGFSGGVTIYVNNFGEGFGEQLEFLSLVPWITITLLRTMEDAAQPSKKKIRLTTTEWAAFKKWLVESRGSPDSSKRAAQEHKAGEH
jgi:hypothetical protein